MDDLNRALSYFKKSWACCSSAPSIRISSAQFAAIILTTQLNWEDSSVLLQGAVELLPFVSVRSLEHTDKQHMLAQFTGLASAAAAAALKAGKSASQALRLLELGRDIIAGLLMEMRGDITDLKEQYPHLADEFIHLREELDSPVDEMISSALTNGRASIDSRVKRRYEADQRFEELIKEIRTQPKFCNFLLPPSAEGMMAAAKPDPIIVINMSAHRCDSFLVERDQIRALELPDLNLEDVQE
ncbi:hypothetical protein DIZ76_016691 [Coccidioides immitis]|nr:hypothetical protein DIZ76_016691 [Coccidioides immitis]